MTSETPASSISDKWTDEGFPIAPSRPLTENEFVAWCDEDIWAEWIDGQVVILPYATDFEADLFGWLVAVLRCYVEAHDAGRVMGCNFQVRFADQRRRRTPDLLYVDKSRLDQIHKYHFEGGPDLVIEIVTDESHTRDTREKYSEYQTAGVREYWMIAPFSQAVEVCGLSSDGTYRRLPINDGVIRSTVVPGFWLKTKWLWRESQPNIMDVLRDLAII
jgi:Uma2 family endonuclease